MSTLNKNLYDKFINNFGTNSSPTFGINVIEDTESISEENINKYILEKRLNKIETTTVPSEEDPNNPIEKTNVSSNIKKCANSLIIYKYNYTNKSGINLYYCDSSGICFPISENKFEQETSV
jgi:hypothetical protein